MPTKGYPAMKFEDDSQYAEIINEIGLEMSIIRTEYYNRDKCKIHILLIYHF